MHHNKEQALENSTLVYPQESIDICDAESYHIEGAKRLADANRDIFGFIIKSAFQDAIQARTLIVAVIDKQVVGFLRYHHRKRDQQTTLYDICVAESARNKNIGKRMIMMLIERCRSFDREIILLKCPSHLQANSFYEKNGFRRTYTVTGKHHDLNIWQLDLLDRRRN